MLVPTFAQRLSWLYAAGNTPATNLTRSVPHGQDADILTLGCGDLRNIFFTAYVGKSHLPRKLDVTCCDIDERIIGRNILLLTLILDADDQVSEALLWDIYYHLYVHERTAQLLLRQSQKLLRLLESDQAWTSGPYARVLKFCNRDTLEDARRVCQRMRDGAQKCHSKALKAAFTQALHISAQLRKPIAGDGDDAYNYGIMRSAGPLFMQAMDELPKASMQYWKEGIVTPTDKLNHVPNPMFAGLTSEYEVLHYGTDPVAGFHLATGFAPLADKAPLTPKGTVAGFKGAAAARTQFSGWIAAFRQLIDRGAVVLRFAVADVFAFSHTLQNVAVSGSCSASWFKRQLDSSEFALDQKYYGCEMEGRTRFDLIDTSNLSDHVGLLNILTATAPLLKEHPWATINTEQMLARHDTPKEAFDRLLCGHAPTISFLLGLSPLQYWTNAKCESHMDESLLTMVTGNKTAEKVQQRLSRLNWKRGDQYLGHVGGSRRVHIEAASMIQLLMRTYRQMFEQESLLASMGNLSSATARSSAYPAYHRASFVAFLKAVRPRIETDWSTVYSRLLMEIDQDCGFGWSGMFFQELCAQMHLQGLITDNQLHAKAGDVKDTGIFEGWKTVPPNVAITLAVPPQSLRRLYSSSFQHKLASPMLAGSIKSKSNPGVDHHFSDVQLMFGKLTSERGVNGPAITIAKDEKGWDGDSELLASFMVPAAILRTMSEVSTISLQVMHSPQALLLYLPILGMSMTIFETSLSDSSKVFVSELMPGQHARRVDSAAASLRQEEGKQDKNTWEHDAKISASVSSSNPQIYAFTGRLDITSDDGKRRLRDKVKIETEQHSPLIINVVFHGPQKLVLPVRFPVPVTIRGIKMRVARTTGYVEVIAQMADPSQQDDLADFIYPLALSSSKLPVALNTPHVNLDSMAKLRLTAETTKFLQPLMAFQFSDSEQRLRSTTQEKSGQEANLRVNFKESLSAMFVTAAGTEAGQAKAFNIYHPQRGGVHMIIVLSGLRLDGDTGSVVLDAALLPLTMKLVLSKRMQSFLCDFQRQTGNMQVNVDDAELALWKRILPSCVERCRTWNHLPRCEYTKAGASIPLSFEAGEGFLCSCGNGKLPSNFVSMKGWAAAAAPHAVRIAISPTFANPIVEHMTHMTKM